jgi:hypothetical protein
LSYNRETVDWRRAAGVRIHLYWIPTYQACEQEFIKPALFTAALDT